MMAAEFLKFAGPKLQNRIYKIVVQMWMKARLAEEGAEAHQWPKEWKVGIVVPLWKRKGDRKDKNTWRGITLLSVGSKLMARIVAARLQKWIKPWMHESQEGFRRGRGVDDVQQVSRRLLEEVSRAAGEETQCVSMTYTKLIQEYAVTRCGV